MSVGLLLVSHSSKIAEGVAELAHQMAASVTIVAAGLPRGWRRRASSLLVARGEIG